MYIVRESWKFYDDSKDEIIEVVDSKDKAKEIFKARVAKAEEDYCIKEYVDNDTNTLGDDYDYGYDEDEMSMYFYDYTSTWDDISIWVEEREVK